MLKSLLLITALSSAGLISIHAKTAVFQNGTQDYSGSTQMQLSAEFEEYTTQNLSYLEKLTAIGVPHGGKKSMFLLRFDKLTLPKDAVIYKAEIHLYQLEENSNEDGFLNVREDQRFVFVYPMQTAFYADSEEGYACFSYRRYGGSGEELYWGDEFKITLGPVKNVDYLSPAIGKIPIAPESGQTWYTVDVTDNVIAGEDGTYSTGEGFLFMASQYWYGIIFASDTYSDAELRPKLVIEYD